MNRPAVLPLLLLLALPLAGGEPRKWEIEISGGWTQVNSASLNAYSDYDRTWQEQVREGGLAYNRLLFGSGFNYTVEKRGEFTRLESGWSGTLRLTRSLSSRLSLTLGYRRLQRTAASAAERNYSFTAVDPDGVDFVLRDGYGYRYDPERVRMRENAAEVGVRWTFWQGRRLGAQAFLHAGPAWVQLHVARSQRATRSLYRFDLLNEAELSGHGVGPRLEAGLRGQWRLAKRWNLFAEAAWALQRIGRLHGTASYRIRYQDGDASGPDLEGAWEITGRWRLKTVRSSGGYGTFQGSYPLIGDDSLPAFRLDSDELQLRAGVSLRL